MITVLEEKNLDEVMVLWLSANIEAHPLIPETYWQKYYLGVKKSLLSANVSVYIEDQRVKGVIDIVQEKYIAGLFVGTYFQSQGVGKLLLDHVKRNYEYLESDMYVENATAIRFYGKTGF